MFHIVLSQLNNISPALKFFLLSINHGIQRFCDHAATSRNLLSLDYAFCILRLADRDTGAFSKLIIETDDDKSRSSMPRLLNV